MISPILECFPVPLRCRSDSVFDTTAILRFLTPDPHLPAAFLRPRSWIAAVIASADVIPALAMDDMEKLGPRRSIKDISPCPSHSSYPALHMPEPRSAIAIAAPAVRPNLISEIPILRFPAFSETMTSHPQSPKPMDLTSSYSPLPGLVNRTLCLPFRSILTPFPSRVSSYLSIIVVIHAASIILRARFWSRTAISMLRHPSTVSS